MGGGGVERGGVMLFCCGLSLVNRPVRGRCLVLMVVSVLIWVDVSVEFLGLEQARVAV